MTPASQVVESPGFPARFIIRRWHGRDKLSIREITRRTGLSRNTLRKYLASGAVEPKYPARKSASKLDPYAETRASWLKREVGRNRKRRRNLKQLHRDRVARGFDGSYDRVAASHAEGASPRARVPPVGYRDKLPTNPWCNFTPPRRYIFSPPLTPTEYNLAQRQWIADVHHHREADYLRRTVEITEGLVHHRRLRNLPSRLKSIYSDNAFWPNGAGHRRS